MPVSHDTAASFAAHSRVAILSTLKRRVPISCIRLVYPHNHTPIPYRQHKMRFSTGYLAPLSLLASAVAADHYQVTVGKNGQLKFDPEQLTAKPGDTITYNFFAKVSSLLK